MRTVDVELIGDELGAANGGTGNVVQRALMRDRKDAIEKPPAG